MEEKTFNYLLSILLALSFFLAMLHMSLCIKDNSLWSIFIFASIFYFAEALTILHFKHSIVYGLKESMINNVSVPLSCPECNSLRVRVHTDVQSYRKGTHTKTWHSYCCAHCGKFIKTIKIVKKVI